ncbi:2-oxo-4-hydroxy-4-carboxy-5-ureidoimidazoline decarboxylase, partial [Mycobacterium sp. ITM-2017-0098]
LFRFADTLLFGLSEESVDSILQAYPDVGRRPGSEKSQAEQCAIVDERPAVMAGLATASKAYLDHFGFGFVMFINGFGADDVLAAM